MAYRSFRAQVPRPPFQNTHCAKARPSGSSSPADEPVPYTASIVAPIMSLKRPIYRAAEMAGLLSAVGHSGWRRTRLLILCYHGVSAADEHEWDPELYVSPARLRQRLEWLHSKRYAILSLGEALHKLRRRALPPRAVAITFDDGARDFYTEALPILAAYKTPATVYLTTYYCDYHGPVFDTALSYLLWKGRQTVVDLADFAESSGQLRITTAEDRRRSSDQILAWTTRRRLSADAKQRLLEELATRLGIDFGAFLKSGLLQLMTPEQVRNLPTDLIDVQLHTHRHRTPRDRVAFERELTDNKQSIARMTADPRGRRHFCYPSGDYDRAFLPWLREWGIESATTCVPGLAGPDSHPLLLPRFVDTMQVSREDFAAWASGFAMLLPRRGNAPNRPRHNTQRNAGSVAETDSNSSSI